MQQDTSSQNALQLGLIAGIAAFTMWGIFPIYLKVIEDVSSFEILAHRILWSVPFGALILSLRKQWPEVMMALRDKYVIAMLSISSLAIAANWLIYIWAILHDRILEASLGYYINPLIYMVAGFFIFGEKLRKTQLFAVALATVGVLVLVIGAGIVPWVPITLAVLFTVYGYIRKTAKTGAMPGLFIEVILLSPAAALYIIWLSSAGKAVFSSGDISVDMLLVFSGPATVLPLVCFALAARRVTFLTLGFLQYIGPTLQFMLGIYYGEALTLFHGICFGFIWAALAVFSFDALRTYKKTA